MLTLNINIKDKINFTNKPVVNLPEHEVGDEAEEGKEGDMQPPQPQKTHTLHPGRFLLYSEVRLLECFCYSFCL